MKTPLTLRLCYVSLATLVAAVHAATPAPALGAPVPATITECDRRASHPEDPDRVVPGLERVDMDLQAALLACEQQHAKDPQDLRARYELARVLFYLGRNAEAIPQMRATADAGYRQAQFVYGAMISNGRNAAPKDLCITEHYWAASARAGRQAARISYVRHTLKGRFDKCPNRVSPEELRDFITIAGKSAHDYYERLLVEDLIERLDSTTRD
ncbi:MAG: hypothetical protein ABI624_00520 [Casimicrobiaceae bacterium]